MGKAFGFLLFLIAAVGTTAVRGADDGINDGVDRRDPNFVTASLVIASPGEELFSCVGHAFIRLECPTFKLDYCFSDESENVRDRVFAFLAGRLKMGMISVPTEKLLDEYRKDRRGVRQYRLNLAPDVKQRLWKLLALARFVLPPSRRQLCLDWLFLGLQSILGAFFTYLITFSALPTAHWNWLIVPFNLLPLVFWRWRRYWAWSFAALLVAWEALMLLYPHQLTDWAYVIIVAAYIVFYAKQGCERSLLR